MGKSLLYRFFRIGSIPKKVRLILNSEEIIISDEGMKGRFLIKNVKGPIKKAINRSEKFSGCFVVTKKRILCYTYLKLQINISVDDPKIKELFVDIPKPNVLSISFEAEVFRKDWEGVMEFQFHTKKAQEFYETLIFIGARSIE